MFGKKKKIISKIEYDKETQLPVIRCSICTGEQVAGFKDKHTGNFTEVMLIKNNSDLEQFKSMYEIQNITKEY